MWMQLEMKQETKISKELCLKIDEIFNKLRLTFRYRFNYIDYHFHS